MRALSGGVAQLVRQLSGSVSSKGPELDLSGSWLCVDVEGDMGAVLEQLGVPWLMRKIARATGYGKGKGADLKNQIHFWPGFRHFIAAQGAHVLMAGTIGMVCTMWLLPSTVLDSWAMDNLKPYSEVSRPDWIFYGCFLANPLIIY